MKNLEYIIALFEDSESSVMVTDPDLNVLWRNRSGMPETVSAETFKVSDPDECFELPVTKERLLETEDGCAVRIKPLFDESYEIEGYMLTFFSEREIERLYCHSGEQRTRANFLGNIRKYLSEAVFMVESLEEKNFEDQEILRAGADIRALILQGIASTVNYDELSNYCFGDIPESLMDLSQRLRELFDWAEPIFKKGGCELKLEIDNFVAAKVSYPRLEAALLNLMINGYMYSDAENKAVTVSVYNKKDMLHIIVEDNGTSADINKIKMATGFGRCGERFSEHEALGLTVARSYAEYFGGELKLENSETGGLTAEIIIPQKGLDAENFRSPRRLALPISRFDPQYCILSKGLNVVTKLLEP